MEAFVYAIGVVLLAGSAQAQGSPEGGDMAPGARGRGRGTISAQTAAGMQEDPAAGGQAQGTWQPPTGQQMQMMQPPPPQPMPDMGMPPDAAPMPEEPELPPGDSDHAGVVGRFGIGFFGVLELPVMGCDLSMALCAAIGNTTVSAPTIGARYWLSDLLGIEAAIGLNIGSGTSGGLETSTLGFALHGGVPLALAHTGHFVFEVVPQLDFGLSSGSYEFPSLMTTTDVSGMLFDIGAKAGAEIHFGFIDIPQLSLQGTIGLMVRHESRKAETTNGALPVMSVEQSSTSVGTGVDGEPWDIFTGSITAIYYF